MTEECRECCNMDKIVWVSFQPSLLCMLSSENLLVTASFTNKIHLLLFLRTLAPNYSSLCSYSVFSHTFLPAWIYPIIFLCDSILVFNVLTVFTFTFDRNKYRWIIISDLFLHTPLFLQKEVQLKKLRKEG